MSFSKVHLDETSHSIHLPELKKNKTIKGSHFPWSEDMWTKRPAQKKDMTTSSNTETHPGKKQNTLNNHHLPIPALWVPQTQKFRSRVTTLVFSIVKLGVMPKWCPTDSGKINIDLRHQNQKIKLNRNRIEFSFNSAATPNQNDKGHVTHFLRRFESVHQDFTWYAYIKVAYDMKYKMVWPSSDLGNSPRIMNTTEPSSWKPLQQIQTNMIFIWFLQVEPSRFYFLETVTCNPPPPWWALQLDVTLPMVRPQGYRPSRHHPPKVVLQLEWRFWQQKWWWLGDEIGWKWWEMSSPRNLSYWGSRSLYKIRNSSIIPVAPL